MAPQDVHLCLLAGKRQIGTAMAYVGGHRAGYSPDFCMPDSKLVTLLTCTALVPQIDMTGVVRATGSQPDQQAANLI